MDNHSDITLDDLQNGQFIYQYKKGFRFGIDGVLLAKFALIKKDDNVLDMCSGSGIVPILLAGKTKGKQFVALEIQEKYTDLAEESVRYNQLQEKIRIVTGDVKNAGDIFSPEEFDVVTCNPPYTKAGAGLENEMSSMYIAKSEVLCTFSDITKQVARVLKNKGRFYFVHRPERLTDLFLTLTQYKLEPKRIRFVHSHIDKEPSLCLVEALKGGNRGIKVERPLIIYNGDGSYTEEVIREYEK